MKTRVFLTPFNGFNETYFGSEVDHFVSRYEYAGFNLDNFDWMAYYNIVARWVVSRIERDVACMDYPNDVLGIVDDIVLHRVIFPKEYNFANDKIEVVLESYNEWRVLIEVVTPIFDDMVGRFGKGYESFDGYVSTMPPMESWLKLMQTDIHNCDSRVIGEVLFCYLQYIVYDFNKAINNCFLPAEDEIDEYIQSELSKNIWIVQDWVGNILFGGEQFQYYDDAIERINDETDSDDYYICSLYEYNNGRRFGIIDLHIPNEM